MSAGTGDTTGNGAKSKDMADKKYACIFSYEENLEKPLRSNVEDTDLMIDTLKKLKFEVENQTEVEVKDTGNESEDSQSDEEDEEVDDRSNDYRPLKYDELVVLNQKPKDIKTFVQDFVRNREGAQCILLYFIVQQDSYTLKTADGKELPLYTLWRMIEGNKCPVLFFIQATVKDKAAVYSILLNSDEEGGGNTTYTLPKSSNMLLAYLPNCVGGQSVAKLLSDELPRPFDVYTNLTKVIERLNSGGCRPSPKYSSTLLKPLHFADGLQSSVVELDPSRCIFSRKHLAKTFIFGKYSNPKMDIYEALQHDREHLDKLQSIGFELEHCVPEGKMTAKEFEDKLKDILLDVSLESCDCFMIFLSTHGDQGGQLYAHDALFSVDFIWQELCSCKQLENKPKVLVIDACRGNDSEKPETHTEKIHVKGAPGQDSTKPEKSKPEKSKPEKSEPNIHMCDTLIVLATTEGMMSYSSKRSGSLLMNTLCEELVTQDERNILNIVTSTMSKVAHQNVIIPKEKRLVHVKQQITFTSTLQKCLLIHNR